MRFVGKSRVYAQTQGAYTTNELFTLTAAPAGQEVFTTPGVNTFIVPDGVFSVCVVAIGGGGGGISFTSGNHAMHGGAGGGLGYKNDIPVTPGASITVQVGAGGAQATYVSGSTIAPSGGDSYFDNDTVVCGRGGPGGQYNVPKITGGDYVGDGGGQGGGTLQTSGTASIGGPPGGGGAGGYNGNGGPGVRQGNADADASPDASSGGAAGGGNDGNNSGYGGGGVGLLGLGATAAGDSNDGGDGGSGGAKGETFSTLSDGGLYGGGGGGATSGADTAGAGAQGAVRVIWGTGRAYPDTNTADV